MSVSSGIESKFRILHYRNQRVIEDYLAFKITERDMGGIHCSTDVYFICAPSENFPASTPFHHSVIFIVTGHPTMQDWKLYNAKGELLAKEFRHRCSGPHNLLISYIPALFDPLREAEEEEITELLEGF